jgi:hypothetical protein
MGLVLYFANLAIRSNYSHSIMQEDLASSILDSDPRLFVHRQLQNEVEKDTTNPGPYSFED